ncbi:membrane transport protein-domain-containing protein [Phlebopus sp. FC_14]|nr:membrane transport protein-domain-containing protein [Phlebopus sp. FC_14]
MHIADSPLVPLIFTVFQSILQVFLLCLAGYILAWKGIVDKNISRALNHINVSLFTPALLFSKVAFFLTPAKLRELWMIPIFFVVVTGLSGLIAHGIATLCRLKRTQRSFATAASMFMNSNSLPIALMQSLVSTVPGLKWGDEDNKDAMLGRALSYLVVFSTLGMIVRWSYGVSLLSQAEEDDAEGERRDRFARVRTDEEASPRVRDRDDRSPLLQYRDSEDTVEAQNTLTRPSVDSQAGVPTARLIHYGDGTHTDTSQAWATSHACRHAHGQDHVHHRHSHCHGYGHCHDQPQGHVPPAVMFMSEDSTGTPLSDSDSDDTLAGSLGSASVSRSGSGIRHRQHPRSASFPRFVTPPTPTPVPTMWKRVLQRLKSVAKSLSPPLLASLLALVTALIPPVQAAFSSPSLSSIRGALEGAGACSVPVTLVVLGGWFWVPKGEKGNREGSSDHGKGRDIDAAAGESHPDNSDGASTHPQPGLLSAERVDPPSRTASSASILSAFGDILKMGYIRHPRVPLPQHRDDIGDSPLSNCDNLPPPSPGTSHAAAMPTSHLLSSSTLTPLPTSPAPSKRNGASSIDHSTSRTPTPPGESLTVFITILSRMVVVPALLLPLLVWLKLEFGEGVGGGVFDDPVFVVSTVLLIASPPALTLAQISQKASAPESHPRTPRDEDTAAQESPFERLLSRTVFWAYCLVTPPVTIACVVGGMVLVNT